VTGPPKFALGNQYGTFPSAAFAWRVLDDPFLKGRTPLSDLKFRVSWGRNGNQSVGNYLSYLAYTYGQVTAQAQLGNQFVTTLRPGSIDPNLKWETTASTNVGLDYGFLENRITGTLDYYTKKTSDLLFDVPTAAGVALSNHIVTNIGSLQNRGFELSLNALLIDRAESGFRWDANFNASTNRNKLLTIDRPGITRLLTGGIAGGVGTNIQVLQPGQPINSFLVYHQIGDTAGVPIYEDLNKDGIINSSDLRPFHNPAPKWILGHTSNISWRRFDASATLRAVFRQLRLQQRRVEPWILQYPDARERADQHACVSVADRVRNAAVSVGLLRRGCFVRADGQPDARLHLWPDAHVGRAGARRRSPRLRDDSERVHEHEVLRRRSDGGHQWYRQ